MYYKIYNRRKFYFTLIQTAKRKMLQLNSVNTNNSTSVEHNSKTLAQNKFNTRQPIQNLTGFLAKACVQTKLLSLEAILLRPTLRLYLCLSLFMCECDQATAYTVYIDKSHITTNLLV